MNNILYFTSPGDGDYKIKLILFNNRKTIKTIEIKEEKRDINI